MIKLIVAESSQQALEQVMAAGEVVEESASSVIDTCNSARSAREVAQVEEQLVQVQEETKEPSEEEKLLQIEQELLKEALAQGHDQNVAFALLNSGENNMLSEPERELIYDTLAKD